MPNIVTTAKSAAISAFLAAGLLWAGNWPEFRGPTAQGISTGEGAPLSWSATENVTWRAAVPGLGWSSPVVWNNQVWLTTATAEGRSLRALAFDAGTGKVLVDREVFENTRPEDINPKNSYASPTPILAEDRVWVHYGAAGTACLNSRGDILWKTKLPYESQHGAGGSPVLFEDLLIVACDGTDVQYVAALDKNTGKIRWKKDRADGYQAYATPLVIDVGGQPQLVAPGAHRTVAYDPRTGKELWFVKYGQGFSNVPRPVYGHGLVFLATGFFDPHIYAVSPEGASGDVTGSHVRWMLSRGAPYTPSPILAGDELYIVSDRGIATCVDARTGKQHWQERLGGNFSASPVLAGGNLYFFSEEGNATIVKPGTTFEKVAENSLGERTFASPAFAEGAMFLRGETHLFRLEPRP